MSQILRPVPHLSLKKEDLLLAPTLLNFENVEQVWICYKIGNPGFYSIEMADIKFKCKSNWRANGSPINAGYQRLKHIWIMINQFPPQHTSYVIKILGQIIQM
jgi:hypothetical protein